MHTIRMIALIFVVNAGLFSQEIDDVDWKIFSALMNDGTVTTISDVAKKYNSVNVSGVYILAGWIALEWKMEDELPVRLEFDKNEKIIFHVKILNKKSTTNDMELNQHLDLPMVKNNYSMQKGDRIYWCKNGIVTVINWP